MGKSQKNIKRLWCSCILFCAPLVLLNGCTVGKYEAPEKEEISFFTGDKAGVSLDGLLIPKTAGNSMPVNALLWRAALDIASFVPLDDVDTFGGSIVTEWHQPKDTPNQRLKLTMFVVGLELRSDAIIVRAYIQNRLGTEWVDAGRDEALGRKLEDLVLNRARELRVAATAQTVN